MPEHLDVRLLRRLLKLLQRNRGLNPPKAIYNRWNEFCDANAPVTHHGGPATRDPKFLDGDLILGFLADLPRSFWVNLIKKVQAEGKDSRLGEAWETYCDEHAPARQGQAGKAIRDPRHLAQEFLIAFISATLERDDQRGHTLATIIDSYQFDFDHGSRVRDQREQRSDRPGGRRGGKGGSNGSDRQDLTEIAEETIDQFLEEEGAAEMEYDPEANMGEEEELQDDDFGEGADQEEFLPEEGELQDEGSFELGV